MTQRDNILKQIHQKKSKSHHYIKNLIETRGVVTNRVDQSSQGLMSYRKIQGSEDFSQISTKLSLPSLAGMNNIALNQSDQQQPFNYQTSV
jgi:hypothetical protein